ncbi:MAG: hypothetical protein R6X12_04675 [bacterium]
MRRLLAVLLFAACAPAQSWFNVQGLGDIGRTPDARSAATGAVAALGWQNPAWLVSLPQTRISAALLGAGALGVDDAGSRLTGTFRPAGFHAAVPLPLGGRLALGFDETFNQDFDIWTESLPDNPYRYHVVSRGGVYALKAGIAWSFLDAACVGLEYSRQLGAARERWRLEASGGSYISVDTVENDFVGNAFKAGAALELGRFGFGAWLAPGHDYGVRTLRRVHGVIGDTVTERSVSLPWSAAAGLRFAPIDRLNLFAGAEYRPWSGIEVNGGLNSAWRDAWRIGGGGELLLARDVPVRLGYSRADLYYDVGWGIYQVAWPVAEHRLHLGTGLPIPEFGALDLGLELARRSGGGFTEYAGRLVVTLAYRESWQRRTRRWGY